MKKGLLYLLLVALIATFQNSKAQERLLYSTDFQNWAALTSTTEQTVNKTTDFSNETLTFKLYQITVVPTGTDNTRFKYSPSAPDAGGVLVTPGWAIAQKVVGSYMQLSPLNSVTKVVFTHGATGSSRGYKLWKKNATDADWVAV